VRDADFAGELRTPSQELRASRVLRVGCSSPASRGSENPWPNSAGAKKRQAAAKRAAVQRESIRAARINPE